MSTQIPLEDIQEANIFTPLNEVEGNAFVAFYKALPKKSDDLVRFFYRKEYYVCYDDDARYIADNYEKSRAGIKVLEFSKKIGSKTSKIVGPCFINLSQARSETIIRDLLIDKQQRVEIYSIGEDRKWFLWKKGSPGNHQQLEDLIYTNSDIQESSVMLSVYITNKNCIRTVGVAFCDVLCQKIGISEFSENEHLTNLESLALQIGTKECFVSGLDEQDQDLVRLYQLLKQCGIVITPKKKSEFDCKTLDQDLRNLLGKQKFVSTYNYLEFKEAMSALSCLIHGLGLMEFESNFERFSLFRYDLSQYMRLDAAAVQALNLIPSRRDTNKNHSLYGLLNHCRTAMGSRKLLQWIKQPLLSSEMIKSRADIVEAFFSDVQMLNELRNQGLRGLADIERIEKKIYRNKATLQDLVILYAFVEKIPKIADILHQYCGTKHVELLKKSFLDPMRELSKTFTRYSNMVEEVIDLEAIELENEFQIRSSFDEALVELDKHKKEIKSAIKKREIVVKSLLKNADHLSLELDKVHGWVYRLTKKEEKILDTKENKKRFIVVSSIKNGVKFQDHELKSLSEEWRILVSTYEENCSEIIARVMEIVQKFVPYFERAHELISDLDVFCSLAVTATSANIPYTRPIIHESNKGDMIMKQARHPILEAQADMKFISNDAILESDESRFLIITGPNMGGKSTFIRQVGLIVIMAQMGSFIPCDEGSEIVICDAILVRIGAGDSQLRGVSTFMAEMLETATILKTATERSLIIIDELGRGTSTYDGFGLAWAISEHICEKIGAFCLFATHFYELTQLSLEIDCVKNKHFAATVDDEYGLILQYNIMDGPSNQSFGIHVAKIAKFPSKVIEIAQEKAEELERFDSKTKDFIKNQSQNNEILERFVDQILDKIANMPLDTYTPDQAMEHLEQLETEIKNANIPALTELFNTII